MLIKEGVERRPALHTGPVAVATKPVFTASAWLSREWPDPHVLVLVVSRGSCSMLRKGGTKTRGAMAPRYARCAGQPIAQTTGPVRLRTHAGGTHQSSTTWPTLPDTVLPHPFPFRRPHLLYRPLSRGWCGFGGGAAAGCRGGVQLREGQPPPDSGFWNPGPRTCRYIWISTSEKSYFS